ncbi:MAG: FliH/SctL family protein [Bryobacteraceae bacterium]|jgi:flagellar assembly protein FliH
MLCKVLAGDRAQEFVEPIVWEPLDGSTAGAARPAGDSSPDTAALQRQIADLERAMQVRVQQARDAAFQEGARKGREEASAELKPVLERLGRSAADLSNLRDRVRRQAETDLVKLALAIAKRVLHRELAIDPDAMQGIVRTALDRLQNREVDRLRVHPSHVGPVRSCLEAAGRAPALEVTGDASLNCGDAIFETSLGELDASVDSQLREIERGFADKLNP